jgi:hypothetical protein
VALQEGGTGAYAPVAAVVAVIERYRDRGLPAPIDADTLVRAGLTTESLAPRTVQSLKLLDLLDDAMQPTAELVALGKVPTDQFKERLAAVLRTAYADVLKFVDPATDDYERVRDQFRPYKPPSLRDRMATLFLGLIEYAGVIPEGRTKELTGRRPATGKARATRPASTRSSAKPPSESSSNGSRAGTEEAEAPHQVRRPRDGHLPPALEGFMRALPEPGTAVSVKRRDQYVQAFASNFDLSYDVQGESDQGSVDTDRRKD